MTRRQNAHKNGIKRGPWSKEEDEKLRAYIQRYGHWNWRELPRFAGVSRCGKSCRLRWMNYLRPNIKHGNFTKEEEDMIVELHNKIGNKWSTMAAKLPGRSDNEIKNYWNTHLRKRVNEDGIVSKNVHETLESNEADPVKITNENSQSIDMDEVEALWASLSSETSSSNTHDHDPLTTHSSESLSTSSYTSQSVDVDEVEALWASLSHEQDPHATQSSESLSISSYTSQSIDMEALWASLSSETPFANTHEHDLHAIRSSESLSTSSYTSSADLSSSVFSVSDCLVSSCDSVQTYSSEYDGNFWTEPLFPDYDSAGSTELLSNMDIVGDLIAPNDMTTSDEFSWSTMDLYNLVSTNR